MVIFYFNHLAMKLPNKQGEPKPRYSGQLLGIVAALMLGYAFGADATSEPGSIAVSRDNLVFVSDNFKHVIKVYHVQSTASGRPQAENENAQLVAKVGGVGFAPDNFNHIAGLSVVDDFLFVADSLNARV
jgi:hypothetical protein